MSPWKSLCVAVVGIPSVAAEAPMNIAETLQSVPDLSSFVDALAQTDHLDALSGDGPFTVFVPLNSKWDTMSPQKAALTAEEFQHTVETHIVSGVAAKTLEDGDKFMPIYPGLTGKGLVYDACGGKELSGYGWPCDSENEELADLRGAHTEAVNLANAAGTIAGRLCTEKGDTWPKGGCAFLTTKAIVECSNGVIVIIKDVIHPLYDEIQRKNQNCVSRLQGLPELSYFFNHVHKRTDLSDALLHTGLTIFAPTNDAFNAISAGSLSEEYFDHLLEYHLGKGYYDDLLDDPCEDVYGPCPLDTLYSGHSLELKDLPFVLTETGQRIQVPTDRSDSTFYCDGGLTKIRIVSKVFFPNGQAETV